MIHKIKKNHIIILAIIFVVISAVLFVVIRTCSGRGSASDRNEVSDMSSESAQPTKNLFGDGGSTVPDSEDPDEKDSLQETSSRGTAEPIKEEIHKASERNNSRQTVPETDSSSSSEEPGSVHEHTWVTEKREAKAAWDEQVLEKEAWDEKILMKDAYDEEEIVVPSWDEQVLVKEAYDETFVIIEYPDQTYRVPVPEKGSGLVTIPRPWDEEIYEMHDFCHCGLDLTVYMREHGTDDIWAHDEEELAKCYVSGTDIHGNPTGYYDLDLYKERTGQEYNHGGWYGPVNVLVNVIHHDTLECGYYSNSKYEVIHHDREYETVHHEAVTELVHHDPEYQILHHEPEYRIVHHEAEYEMVTRCSECGVLKE